MAWMVYSRTGLRTLDVEDIAVHVIVQCIQYPTAVISVTIGICDKCLLCLISTFSYLC